MIDIPLELQDASARWEDLTPTERTDLGRSLRRLGLSYREIQSLVPVSKGTLSRWCRGIELTPKQSAAIRTRTGSVAGQPRDTQWRRRLEVEQIRAEASRSASTLIDDPLWCTGVALYWGEGEKSHRRLAMTNTDAALLRLFRMWVERWLMPEARYALSLHLHVGDHEARAMGHWREALDLPDARFTKSFVKPAGTGHRRNLHPHGVCRVVVSRSTDAFITTMAWIDAVSDLMMGRNES